MSIYGNGEIIFNVKESQIHMYIYEKRFFTYIGLKLQSTSWYNNVYFQEEDTEINGKGHE